MVKKIIVFGFAHSGTTILKSIIGHIENVEEIYPEQKIIKPSQLKTDKKYIVCKWPEVLPIFFESLYQDYIKVFITRDPRWVFSSLNRRDNPKMLLKYNFHSYRKNIQLFNEYRNSTKISNLYTIKYEDMFENNFSNLKQIFQSIGLSHDDTIFDNKLFKNICNKKGDSVPKQKPDEKKHGHFRKWQINQPISNMNDPQKIVLTEDQRQQILSSQSIQQIYPNINNNDN